MAIRWTVFLSVALAACGEAKSPLADAPPSDTPPRPECSATAAPTAPATSTADCNPLAQTGCAANEKCTWIDAGGGRVGCVPAGKVEVGCACSTGEGYDDCARGSLCIAGECKSICDPAQPGVASGCNAQHVCSRYSGIFEVGGNFVAGACDPQCDPLTQELLVGLQRTACGSTDAAQPDKGCYTGDFQSFTCAPAGALTRTDRTPASTTPGGPTFVNSCAPGYVPFFFEATGSMQVMCTGLCAPLEIDNTKAGNARGDAAALGKLVNRGTPAAGDATCEPTKKGSEAQQNCVFVWSFLVDGNGNPSTSPFNETLGVCFGYTHFRFDSNGDGTPDTQFPACEALPPRSASTPGGVDDAADFGCQRIANSQKSPLGAPMRAFRLAYGEAVLTPHVLR